jgi:hypothetical protein
LVLRTVSAKMPKLMPPDLKGYAHPKGCRLPPFRARAEGEGEMSTTANDDKSPLIDLLSCIVCNETMKLEKSSPDAKGMDIIQYRCGLCNRIERVRLFRRSREAGS